MIIHWKQERTRETATLANLDWRFEDGYLSRTRVLGGELPAYVYPMHELHLMSRGRITTRRHTSFGETRTDSAQVEQMCIVSAGQCISAEWDDDFEMLVIGFSPDHLARTALELTGSPQIRLVETMLARDSLIEGLSMAILSEDRPATARSALYTEAVWRTIMLHVVRRYSDAKPATSAAATVRPHKMFRAQCYMEENLAREVTIAEVAAAVNLSYFHFIRAFRDAVGSTPQQFITHRRLEAAKTLLARGELPIIEVCARTGFKNQSHFTRLFRGRFGLTPRAWQQATRPLAFPVKRNFSTASAVPEENRSGPPGYALPHDCAEAGAPE